MLNVLRIVRPFAGEEFVEHQAQRVNVAFGADARAFQLLRRHVGGGAVAHLGAGKLIGNRGQSEIHDDDFAALVDHDVLRLEVAMNHAAIVRRRKSGAELAGGLDCLVRGQSPDAQEQRRKVFAVHILHGDERHAFDFADVVNAADVGVRYQARHAHFAVESLQQALIARRLFAQKLQGYRLSERQVGGRSPMMR